MRNPPPVPPEFQQVPPLTKVCKYIVFANVLVWLLGSVILEQHVLKQPLLTLWFSLIPSALIKNYFFWQPFTYMFLHPPSPFAILFNMLMIWAFGGELEKLWGSRFFLLYYFVSGVGAAFLYVLFVLIYSISTGRGGLLTSPVLGATGAAFGLLIAYGLVFGERIVYFMFFFPMKAKWLVAIMGGIAVVMVLNSGVDDGYASNLAHVFGLASGFLFLWFWSRTRGGPRGKRRIRKASDRKTKLKLVVNNMDEFNSPENKPKYWN